MDKIVLREVTAVPSMARDASGVLDEIRLELSAVGSIANLLSVSECVDENA